MPAPSLDETTTSGALTEAVAIEWAATTDVGRVRELNEDTVLAEAPEPGSANPWRVSGLLLVADGMGGHRAGEVASGMAADLARQVFLTDQAVGLSEADVQGEALEGHVAESVRYFNRVVHRHGAAVVPSGAGGSARGGGPTAPPRLPGTTLTLCLVRPSEFCIAHVGDSRAYLIGAPAAPRIRQLTDDDSLVAEAVRRGELTAEQARTSPFRNHITKAIGTEPEIEPAVFSGEWNEGEVLLLCTDGLTEYVTPDEMLEFVHNTGTLQAACRALIAIANHRGGQDNISVVAARHGGSAAGDEPAAGDENAPDALVPIVDDASDLEPALANGDAPAGTPPGSAPLAATFVTEITPEPLDQVESAEMPVPDLQPVEASDSPAVEVAAPIQEALDDVDAEIPEDFPEFVLPRATATEPMAPADAVDDTNDSSQQPSTMSTTKPSPGKPAPVRTPAPRPSAPRPSAPRPTAAKAPAKPAPASRPAAAKPAATRAPAPRSSAAGQAARRPEGSGNAIQRERAIALGILAVIVTAVFMVLGVRADRHERSKLAAGNATGAIATATVASNTAAPTTEGNAVAPPIADGSAGAAGSTGDVVPITIWLDAKRQAIVIASKGHTIKAESGSNGNPVEADTDRPTRSLVSFKHWDVAAKQLGSGDAELVCRIPVKSRDATTTDATDHFYRSKRDDDGHVKLNVTEASPETKYVLEFRHKGDKEGQELAQFSIQSATAAATSAAHGETAGGESGASSDNTATDGNSTHAATDAGSDNNVQR